MGGAAGLWMGFNFISLLFVPASSALFQRLEHPVKADGSLSLVVIGDWGRKGAYNQSQVANQVYYFIIYCLKKIISLLISIIYFRWQELLKS